MALITRRKFVQQTTFAAASLYGCSVEAMLKAGEQTASLDSAAVRKFASEISGHVSTSNTPDYDAARQIFNRAFDLHPALIVRCGSASDVARSLDFAQKHNLPVAVHGGGHSRLGYGMCDGGAVIDLSGMKRVEVDASKRVARAERSEERRVGKE